MVSLCLLLAAMLVLATASRADAQQSGAAATT
jgi:hypothetical protein